MAHEVPHIRTAEPGPRYAARLIAWTDAIARRVGDRRAIAGFVIACVGMLVAEDIGAATGLRAGLGRWVRRPESLGEELAEAWARMCADHPGLRGVLGEVPALEAAEVQELAGLAELDWSAVEPAILGTLIERSLQADERARLGAYFTRREFIERLARPTIVEPLADAWAGVLAEARAEVGAEGQAAARAGILKFHGMLRAVRVLDPACGTGNFLYVALDLLRALEDEVLAALRGFGGEAAARVQPDQLYGIETERRARDVAALVLWLGFMKRGWRGGEVAAGNLEVRDALLRWDGVEDVVDGRGRPVRVSRQGKRGTGTAAALRRYHGARAAGWPEVDFIVSNPPFIGNKRMRDLLGDGYVEALRAVYAGAVPGDVDLVGYWWHRAAAELRAGRLRRFGMITTNSIRQAQSGAVVRRWLADPEIVMHAACADHPWAEDDAAVRISMTVVRRADEPGARAPVVFNSSGAAIGEGRIHADLSAGVDLARAVPLAANRGLCFQGMNLVGDGFRLSEAEAEALLGKRRPAVLRPYLTGRDLLYSDGSRRYVIDFYGHDLGQARRAAPQLLRHLEKTIKGLREGNRRDNYRRIWWQFGEPRPGLRRALAGIDHYVATAETSRHRVFVRLAAEVVPDHQLYAVASDDAYVFGVLSARPHATWALHAGGRNGAGNDPRWTSTRTFAPYPFPAATEAQRAEIRGLAATLEAVRAELLARAGGSLTELYNAAPAALRAAHAGLDAAVLAAYGWGPEVEERELLARLLIINAERAEEEARGVVRAVVPRA